jgi:hypothetical protein
VGELGENRLHLAGVAEGALGLAHNNARPAATGICQLSEKSGRLSAHRPRQRPRGIFVMDNHDDFSSTSDQGASSFELPT